MSTATATATQGTPAPGESSRRCRATSTTTGERCRRWAIAGGFVCPFHGGAAVQVKAAARERLREMLDPTLALMAQSLERELASCGRVTLPSVRLMESILDRAGFPRTTRLEVEDEARELVALQGERIAAALVAFASAMGLDVRSPECREAARHALEVASGEELPPMPRHARVERRMLAAAELEDEDEDEEDAEEDAPAVTVEEPDEVLVP